MNHSPFERRTNIKEQLAHQQRIASESQNPYESGSLAYHNWDEAEFKRRMSILIERDS